MGDRTGISWTDATWNPVRGCSIVSTGCANCYAMRVAARFSGEGQPYEGLTTRGAWNGQIRVVREKFDQPLRWARPRRIFVNSMSDLFHSGITFGEKAMIFAVMALASRHTFQVLTKRPDEMLAFMTAPGAHQLVLHHMDAIAHQIEGEWSKAQLLACYAATEAEHQARRAWPPRNVHLGISAENQETLDARWPLLAQTPAALRFVSAEPLLGEMAIGHLLPDAGLRTRTTSAWRGAPAIDWIIVGGESAQRKAARSCDVAWIRSIVAECRGRIPCFVKQLGANILTDQRTRPEGESWVWTSLIKDRAGADPGEWPDDLRVQEFPR